MNVKRYLLASAAAAVWLFVYGFVTNAILLMDYWVANTVPGTMRPEGEEIMWAIVVSQIVQAFALGFIFTKGYEARGIGEGFRFGLLVAWFVAGIYLLFYAIQPWHMEPTLVAIVNDGLMYVGAGVVLALIYKT